MKKLLLYLFMSVALSLCSMPSCAEEGTDSLNLKFFFRSGSSTVNLNYLNNASLLNKFISDVRAIISNPAYQIQEISVRSSASPEGNFKSNMSLSQMRGRNLKAYLQKALSIPSSKFNIEAVGEDWVALRNLVEQNDVPDKQRILDILDKYPEHTQSVPTSDTGKLKKELMSLDGGRTWKWLLNNIFPDLRSAGNNTICRYTRVEPKKAPEKKQEAPVATPKHHNDTIVVIHKYIIEVDTAKMVSGELPFKMEVKVPGNVNVTDSIRSKFKNSLIDASFAPNIEIKVPDNNKNVGVSIDNKVVIPQRKKSDQ
ncbi:MAG: OmpA family protein [Prevotellaceae bacterium]|nr:OmpA family protein [Prevotellaceae bacterium]